MQTNLTIQKEHGLHARPAAEFVKLAGGFESEIQIEHNGDTVDAKSIMSIMGLGLSQGTEIILHVNGTDEASANESLKKFLSGDA